jgi:hypothetical protein
MTGKPFNDIARNCRSTQPSEGALPNHRHTPTLFAQPNLIAPVAGYIFSEFFEPEFWSRSWRGCILASLVAVPKAALDQNHRVPLRQYDIRGAGQAPVVQAESEAARVEGAPKFNLRSGMLTPDARHHPRTGRRINNVDQCISPGAALQTWYGLWL